MKAERTRQFIIEKTAPLFNTKGFDGTSLSDMEKATGLSKGSIYGNFEDKEEIASEAFRYAVRRMKDLARMNIDQKTPYKEQLIALLGFFSSYVFDPPVAGGCPILNTAIEADDYRKTMRKVVAKEVLSTVDFIGSLLEKGVKSGEFRTDIEPRALAYTFFCAIEGAIIFSRLEKSREPMDIVVNHCKTILEKISI